MQSQVRFRVRNKEHLPRRLWCRARSGSTWFNRVPEKVPVKVLVQSQVRFNGICSHLTQGNSAEVFPALGFAARFRKICKNKMLRLLGISPKLILYSSQYSPQQNFAMVSLAQMSSGAIRCSFDKVPEGSGADTS